MEGVKTVINTETSAPTYLVSNDSVTQTISLRGGFRKLSFSIIPLVIDTHICRASSSSSFGLGFWVGFSVWWRGCVCFIEGGCGLGLFLFNLLRNISPSWDKPHLKLPYAHTRLSCWRRFDILGLLSDTHITVLPSQLQASHSCASLCTAAPNGSPHLPELWALINSFKIFFFLIGSPKTHTQRIKIRQ